MMMSMTRFLVTTSFLSGKRHIANALLAMPTSTSSSLTNRSVNRGLSFIAVPSSALSLSSVSSPSSSLSIAKKTKCNNGRYSVTYPNLLRSRYTYATSFIRGANSDADTERDGTNDNDQREDVELGMEKLYCEWTLDDDRFLYNNRKESIPKLATMLGRGLRGVQARLLKISHVDSPAYARLFSTGKHTHERDDGTDYGDRSNADSMDDRKLTPAHEIMRRIRWDINLVAQDFTVFYYDRVEGTIQSSSFEARNESVKGAEESFVFAIPEHRITSFSYKERTVWDKNSRLDCVFGTMNGNKETIDDVIQTYSTWKQKKDEMDEVRRQRQADITRQIDILLGKDAVNTLRDISSRLQDKVRTGAVETIDDDVVEQYAQTAINLCRSTVNKDDIDGDENVPSSSSPTLNLDALDSISNLVALYPDKDVSERILLRVEQLAVPTKKGRRRQQGNDNSQSKTIQSLHDIDIDEDDLKEKFIRGSGAGGQKVNKTANKVLLVHVPTGVRVECQDTRSLQQNRKIARKRLRSKLDEHWNGANSKVQVKKTKMSGKKAKAKARNKARRRKKNAASTENED